MQVYPIPSASTDPKKSFERIELEELSFARRYKYLSGAIIPRPIALVTTRNLDGSINAAPFSSFMMASVEEGLLAFSVGPSDPPKMTLENIKRTGLFVINTVSETMAEKVQRCGEDRSPEEDVEQQVGFRVIASRTVDVPRIMDSNVHFECKLSQIIKLGSSHMVVGKIAEMHVWADVLEDGKIKSDRYAPLGRIAGRNYCLVRNILSI